MNPKVYDYIREEPEVLRKNYEINKDIIPKIATKFQGSEVKRVFLIGSGTSYHACLAGFYLLNGLSNTSPFAFRGSEFLSFTPKLRSNDVIIALSHSGSSVDVLDALKKIRGRGVEIIGITGFPDCPIATFCDEVLITQAGAEEWCPATKSLLAQLHLLYYFLVYAFCSAKEGNERVDRILTELASVHKLADETIKATETKARIEAEGCKEFNNFMLLGAGPSYMVAEETALKLVEMCGVRAQALPPLEALHGWVNALDKDYVVFAINPPGKGFSATRKVGEVVEKSSVVSKVIWISKSGEHGSTSEEVIDIPCEIDEIISPILYLIPLQLFSCYLSLSKGMNPDKLQKLDLILKHTHYTCRSQP